MNRISALSLAALALAACAPDTDPSGPDLLPTEQAGPPLTWNHPGYFIKGVPFTLQAQGANPNGTAALVISAAPGGAPYCPPAIAPDCLDVPTPAQIIATRPLSQGRVQFVVNVPNNAPPRAWMQVGALSGGVFFKTDAIDTPLLTATGDADSDGITNIEEAQTVGTDPLNPDTDADGLSDGDELGIGTDPLDHDSDDDNLTDFDEIALGTDPSNPDTDADGLPDGDEVSLFGTDPSNPDSDFDGLFDGAEITLGTNPNNNDTDSDGLFDGSEVSIGTDPLNADSDGDGFNDGDELTYGTDALNPDTDGGGELDGAEILAGRDPFDPADDFGGGGIGPRLLITEVVDHATNTGARFVEIYNSGDAVADLTGYAIQRYSNGGTTPSNINITAGATLAPGAFYVIAASSDPASGFPFVFGIDASQYNGGINSNGDDVYALYDGANVIDVWGEIGVQPPAGTSWNFTDSFAFRNAGVDVPTAVFNFAEWTLVPGTTGITPFVR